MTPRILTPVVLLAALVPVACGGEPSSAGTANADQAARRQALLDYAQCMREHGIDFPDPTPGSGKVVIRMSSASPAKMQAAEQACQKYRDKIKPRHLSPAEQQRFRQAALANARCMREHGIDMPDPTFDANGAAAMQFRKGGGVNPNSAAFKAAQQACESTMPMKGPSKTQVGE
jgi:hypothetical protein